MATYDKPITHVTVITIDRVEGDKRTRCNVATVWHHLTILDQRNVEKIQTDGCDVYYHPYMQRLCIYQGGENSELSVLWIEGQGISPPTLCVHSVEID